MKVSEINRLIEKHFPAELKGYTIHKGLIYKIENEFFLKAYDFESSGNGEYDLAVWCFIQPLVVKHDSIIYTFGDRLSYRRKINWFKTKQIEWWDASKENLDSSFKSIFETIISEGEKYLQSINTAEEFYKKYSSE